MIRPLRSSDYDGMIHILRVGPRSRYKIRNTNLITEPNKEKWDKFFGNLGRTTAGWVKEVDGKIVGIVLGMVVENFWDTQRVGRVILWYVDPEYRGVTAVLLFRNLQAWFYHQEVDYLMANCDFDSEAGRAYRKMGFKPLEETLYLVGGIRWAE